MAGEEGRSLLVRGLPEGIPDSTLSRLFSHFGASSVRSFPSNSHLRNSAFVHFHSQSSALHALRHFHGLRFLGKVLRVERTSKPATQDENNSQKPQFSGTHLSHGDTLTSRDNLSNSNSITAEPIAPSLGVDYPFPPHIEYAYPPPDDNILTNIVNSLIAVPRFYTQVLHLMNKMNIPAPFRMATPTPPLPPLAPVPAPPPPLPAFESTKQYPTKSSSEESEMESSDEEVDVNSNTGEALRKRKRIKRDAIVGPAVDKDVAHEAVGVKEATLVPKEIPMIKKRNPVLQIKIAYKAGKKENNDESITGNTEEREVDSTNIQPFATTEELQNGKLGLEELLSLPVYKNYKVGTPASVLYIKNLAKDVVNDDFYYIFGSLFDSVDSLKSSLGVKLMQEGRMRGQAFVTFPSVELAHHALNLVNGFEFKGKPMVIQFGRSPAASKEK